MSDRKKHVLLLIIVWMVLYLPNLWVRNLAGTDEPKYAQVAREIIQDGHWFAMHFNGKPYYGEPPLYFWLQALISLPRGDVTEFTAQLPSCLLALGTILVTYILGSKLFNPQQGLLAALMLATTTQFFKFGYMGRLDVPFAFFVTACLMCFYLGFKETVHGQSYFLMAWVLLGLASITHKGPVAIFLILSIVVLWKRRELATLKMTSPIRGLFISALVVSVWLLPACLVEGISYLQGLFGQFEHHVNTPVSSNKFLFYLSTMFVDSIPWSLLLPVFVYWYLFKSNPTIKEELELPLIWFLVFLLTFSILLREFSRYIIPLYPAMALFLARFWGEFVEWPPLREWTPSQKALFWGLAPIFGLFFAWVAFSLHDHRLVLSYPLLGLMGTAVLSLFGMTWLIFRDKQWGMLFAVIFLITISFQVCFTRYLIPWENEWRSEKVYCEQLREVIKPSTPWAVYKLFRPALVYYTKTRPEFVDSELVLTEFLSSPEKVYCLLWERDYNELVSKGTNLFRVAEVIGLHKKRLILATNKPK